MYSFHWQNHTSKALKDPFRHVNKFNNLKLKQSQGGIHDRPLNYHNKMPTHSWYNHMNDNNSNNNHKTSLSDVTNKLVLILSSTPHTEAQTSHLGKGPKFNIVPRHPSKGDYVSAVKEVCHWLPFKVAAQLRADTSKLLDKTHIPRPNITIQEAKAIKELRTDQSRIILTMDKGTVMVVIDRQDYNCKALELLYDKDTNRIILKDPNPKIKSQLINLLRSCKTWGQIIQDPYKKFTPLLHPPPYFMAYPKSTKQASP